MPAETSGLPLAAIFRPNNNRHQAPFRHLLLLLWQPKNLGTVPHLREEEGNTHVARALNYVLLATGPTSL